MRLQLPTDTGITACTIMLEVDFHRATLFLTNPKLTATIKQNWKLSQQINEKDNAEVHISLLLRVFGKDALLTNLCTNTCI